jgi:ribosomal protein S18 acetylase RimI-like enzyme
MPSNDGNPSGLFSVYLKMEITIRRAVREDCPRMLQLVNELARFERAPDEVTVTTDHFEESGFGPNPVYWAFVAEENGFIVAFALYYIRYSTWKGQRMYLEDILVTQSHRGRKIGQMLMDRLIVEAREKNLHGITWQVLEWNEPAIRFYDRYHPSFDKEWINCSITV